MSETHYIYDVEGKVLYEGEGCTSLREALEKAIREKVDLYRAYLRGANLQEADLQEANFYRANLQGANLYEANLQGANLYEANLQGANLCFANLDRANLTGANLSKAELWRTNLQEAELWGAHLQGANLCFANLEKARLYRANLQGADLKGANFSGAYLWITNLEGADLKGTKLQGADLREAIFTNANVSDTVLDPSMPCPDATEALRAAGLPIDDQGFVLAYRTEVSIHFGTQRYEVGQRYQAPYFSIDTTSAWHPGLYLATKEQLTKEHPGKPWVKVRTHVDSVVAAGDRFRARWLEVIELVKPETLNE